MLSHARRFVLLLLSAFALLATSSVAAHADTYEAFGVGVTFGQFVSLNLGLTPDGALIEEYGYLYYPQQSRCPSSEFCYVAITANGTGAATACTPSNGVCNTGLAYDNGTPCTVAIPNAVGPSEQPGVCNNGHAVPYNEILYLDANNVFHYGEYSGSNYPNVYSADPGTLLVDKEGDFAFHDYFYRQDIFFIDLTSRTSVTPEPSSFALLGTGLAAAKVFRRRVRSQG